MNNIFIFNIMWLLLILILIINTITIILMKESYTEYEHQQWKVPLCRPADTNLNKFFPNRQPRYMTDLYPYFINSNEFAKDIPEDAIKTGNREKFLDFGNPIYPITKYKEYDFAREQYIWKEYINKLKNNNNGCR